MWIRRHRRQEIGVSSQEMPIGCKDTNYYLLTPYYYLIKDMAYPARLVFTPFVVVVGGKYFLPVPECLIF